MKLRNKKTGTITKLVGYAITGDGRMFLRFEDDKGTYKKEYTSLAELNEEWEDYEEPKSWWYIDCDGEVFRGENADKEHTDNHKSIGNYYISSEEAEKAVEKLKAWKRLKDKGFRFDLLPSLGHCDDEKFDISIIGTMPAKWWYKDNVIDDIHYVFGGEE